MLLASTVLYLTWSSNKDQKGLLLLYFFYLFILFSHLLTISYRKNQLRILESTAPCTMPPFVAATWVPKPAQKIIAHTLSRIHHSEKFQSLLKENGFARFAKVSDEDYDSVRLVRKMYHHHN